MKKSINEQIESFLKKEESYSKKLLILGFGMISLSIGVFIVFGEPKPIMFELPLIIGTFNIGLSLGSSALVSRFRKNNLNAEDDETPSSKE